ncbi:Ycf4 [Synechococcus sp. PCC 7502]|uniref:photosystem I assembly protein Ycf4 n=1 Tax=Synechococcus sp. PCC 7502 TaxID=1173263 RepID=UPI00029FC996|nr:photosystem I assembly protein Ycf4 [Synechococcus sp. PCC 7502]AFY75110.1 Ycf4 [Synechococcus sp. PCC 7502]
MTTSSPVLTYPVLGARRPSNYIYAVIVAIGAVGFSLAGLSSYFHINLLPTETPLNLNFIPQGLALSFYGVAGTLLDIYLWTAIVLDIGGGFNEFNLDTGKLRIFRLGFPGKNRTLDFSYALADVQAVKVEIRDGLNPKRSLYLRLKGRGDIPLTEVGQPISLSALEDRAAELAKFLSVPLEGI